MKGLYIYFTLFFWSVSIFGQTVKIDLVAQESPIDAHFRGLWVVNESIIWASGTKGSVIKTLDGGKTWQKIIVAGFEDKDFRDVVAFDDKKAFIINAGSPAYILKTEDGGVSWNTVYQNESPKAFLDDIGFYDHKKIGFVFGDPDESGNFVLLKSNNMGDSWENTGNLLPKPQENEAGFAASGTIMRFKNNKHIWIGTGGGKESRVLYSGDEGKTWKSFSTPILSGKNSQGIFSMAFKDKNNGIAVGGDYTLPNESGKTAIYTKNGGKTWNISKSMPSGYRSSISHVKKDIYVCVGTNGTDMSKDGGKTWQNISSEGFNTVRFTQNGKVGWAVGNKGKIFKLTVN
ncbi:MAG: YCF48-related protein [Raineya sp.]|jgi:photosystem II stability/assembly factor-like uncharacterized protein|nr:YCF48-related protein [Raineya sp.]